MNILRRIDKLPVAPKWRVAIIVFCIVAPCCLLSVTLSLISGGTVVNSSVGPAIQQPPNPTIEFFTTNALWLGILLWLGLVFINRIRLRENYSFINLLKDSLPTLAIYSSFGAAIQFQQGWLYGLGFLLLPVPYILLWRRNIPYYKPSLKQFHNKNFDQALLLSNQAVQARPKNWQVYILRASIQYELGNLSNAQSDCEQAIQLKPKETTAHTALGSVWLAQSQYQKSKAQFVEARRLKPKDPVIRWMLGRVHYRLEEYAQAAEELNAALQNKRSPLITTYIRAYYYLGRSLEALNQSEQAKAAFENMGIYKKDIERVQEFIANHVSFPETIADRADVENIERRLLLLNPDA